MKIRIGYELIYDCPQPTPMILTLSVHYTRVSDIIIPDHLIAEPPVPVTAYRDSFGNWCSRIVAPKGQLRLSTDALVKDTGQPDQVVPQARQTPVEELPDETLLFLLGSRYCETDLLSQMAWDLFGKSPTGWERVQAICDFVHQHIAFGYEHARPTKTAWEAFQERTGVCGDYTHLAIAFCRCMNIPARYCTGYLGDIGVPPPYGPMDFAARFEAYLDGHWYTFGARNNIPRTRVDRPRPRRHRRRHQQYLRSQHPEQFQDSDRRGERGVKRLKGNRAFSARPSHSMYSASCLRRKRFSPASASIRSEHESEEGTG
jgi:transglutaminase-like putative cysteine protease